MLKKKVCKGCGEVRAVEKFLDASGTENPRGSLCSDCYLARMKEEQAKFFENLPSLVEAEKNKIRRLRILYGRDWRRDTMPNDFYYTLLAERDFCPYCGEQFEPENLMRQENIELDHMDPLSMGGEDSIRNVVFVCRKCNQAKKKKPFMSWMNQLKPQFRDISRKIYIEKHRHPPEDFKEGPPIPRDSGIDAELMLDEESFNQIYGGTYRK
jgi:hypothetical protein